MFDGDFRVHLGDCVTHMPTLPPAAFDLAVFSPPFPALYAYTAEPGDIGNSDDLKGEMRLHLSFFYRQLARVLRPGRVAVVHVMQIPRMKRAGGQGLCDFRGLNIRLGERAGLTYEYDWCVRKNPQAQAIRGKAWELKFQGIETDRAMSRGALPDYLIKFRAPGDNAKPVSKPGEVRRNDWIEWAECCWGDIRETATLNLKGTKGDGDTKHICPLQLPVIERLVKLFSDPGELVFSPFAGIGSELYVALKLGRRAYGCELKEEYHATAVKNCERAVKERAALRRTLFDKVESSA
jgi:DNA modification methylase